MKRFLLLSDIHFLYTAREQDEHSRVRDAFLEDIRDFVASNGKFDNILISGDIASKGKGCEFEEAKKFLEQICKTVNCELQDIYVVPGNHDKDFSAANSELRHIIDEGLSHDDNGSSQTSNLFYDLVCHDSKSMQLLYTPFKEYNQFAMSLLSYEPLMQKCIDDVANGYDHNEHKAYYKELIGELDGYKIYLFGMNTCLNCDCYDEDDNGKGHKMFLSPLAYNAQVDKTGCINICMMHHPIDRIANGDKIKEILNKNFHLQIFGHLHKPASSVDTSVHIQSGALQPPKDNTDIGDSYFSVYNIVELEIEEQSKLLVRLFVERYDSSTDRFEELKNESQTFRIPLSKHENRWTSEKKVCEETENLPAGVSARQIMIRFMGHPSRHKIIKEMGGTLCKDKSLNDNSIDFLKKMEKEKRLDELWTIIR
jgi:DNA repair exonuclease SbcCD nuclease subunit